MELEGFASRQCVEQLVLIHVENFASCPWALMHRGDTIQVDRGEFDLESLQIS